MAIKVAKLENLFGTNGSFERPNTTPDIDTFEYYPNLLPDGNEQKTIGTIILKGDGNYAFCEDQGYFLNRLKVADREGVYHYGLVKDGGMNFIEREVSLTGFCTRTSNKQLLLKNINYVEPIIVNPCRQQRINLSDDITRVGGEELEIKRPELVPEELTTSTITTREWYRFIIDCKAVPVQDSQLAVVRDKKNDTRYKKGVVIVGELETSEEQSLGKPILLEKIDYLLSNLHYYSLSKVSEAGLGTRAVAKNHYVLTPTHGGIGQFEETARVTKLDFSGLKDIVPISAINLDESSRAEEFRGIDLAEENLAREHHLLVSEALQQEVKKYRVLQRKVYLPYLRKSGGTENDFLYRGNLSDTDLMTVRAQDSSIVSEYVESEPFVPIYQGSFAQGLKTKSKPNESLWLPYINQLDTTFNGHILNSGTTQGQGNLNKQIPFYNEENPPQFGFLLLDFVRERKDGTGGHYRGRGLTNIPVLVGLNKGGDVPEFATNDRDVKPGVDRVSKGWSNFQLINSLYPLSGVYYFSALKNNSLKISFHDGKDGGGNSGGFGFKVGTEGTRDFSSYNVQAYLHTNIDNNRFGIDDYDKPRKHLIAKYGILDNFNGPINIETDDIFFSDLIAFGEEYEAPDSNYDYATELGGYLDVKKNHRKLDKQYKKNKEKSKLVFYWNNNLQKYQLGVYHTLNIEHQLSTALSNDIVGLKFKDDNSNTTKAIKSYDDTITKKTIRYHHISQLRNIETKRKAPLKAFNKTNFIAGGKTEVGIKVLDQLNNLLSQAHDNYSYYYSTEPFTPRYKKEMGVPNGELLGKLPRYLDGTYNLEEIFAILNLEGGGTKENYVFNRYAADTIAMEETPGGTAMRIFFAIKSLGTSEIGHAFSKSGRKSLDFLKFAQNKGIADWSAHGTVKKIRDVLNNQIRNLFEDPEQGLGKVYTFNSSADLIKRLNTPELQKDIYTALGLIDAEGRYVTDISTIKDRLFDLVGTGYGLWIDNEEQPHLIFRPETVKSDIELKESKVFRIPQSELPRQDYIDAINQKTFVQVSTSNFPLDERIIFEEYSHPEIEENINTNFKLYIDRFSIADKTNPNDYYIINYQGARQLLDIRLAIPKRTLAQTKSTDVGAKAQLALEQEKWREDFKIRKEIMKIEREKEVIHEQSAQERQYLNRVAGGLNLAGGIIGNIYGTSVGIGLGMYAHHHQNYMAGYARAGLDDNKMDHYDRVAQYASDQRLAGIVQKGIGGLGSLASGVLASAVQLSDLSIQGRELEADIKASLGLFNQRVNQLNNEHHFTERQFAMRLMEIGNVYQQGEVNDRDINDQYNDTKGLSEVHLIYRTPSSIQREGLERYYELHGSNCHIPEVTFNFSKNLEVGTIGQFGFIDKIVNLWAIEEKDVLKIIFANGVKILSLRNIPKAPPALPPKLGTAKADELLAEASPEERDVLFNKLTRQLDQLAIIKHLAENVPNKNSLVEVITPLLNRASLLAKLAEDDSKEELTEFVIKLLNRIDQEVIFNELLSRKDKERLIEQGIDDGTNALRVIGDKYPTKVISKDEHDEKIAQREEVITEFRNELKELYSKNLKSTSDLGNINEELSKAKTTLDSNEKTISNQKEQIKTLNKTIEEKDETIKDKDEKIEAEKRKTQLATQKNAELQQALSKAKETTGTLIDAHSNVDYLITKRDDKVVITAGNKEKNIGQEQPDLIVKRRDETRLLRIANKKEEYKTDQYPLGSGYRNQHGSKYNITVSTFATLEGYVVGQTPKNLHAGVGRYSVEIDTNAPYIDKDGNGVKPYGYHSTKGGFDYDIGEGARRINSYEEYLELSKNALTDLQKELQETKDSLAAVREIEQAKEQLLPDRWATTLLGNMIYNVTPNYVFDEHNLKGNRVELYAFDRNYQIFTGRKSTPYEAKKIYDYKSQTFGAIRFTELNWNYYLKRSVGEYVSSTEYTQSNVYDKANFVFDSAMKFNDVKFLSTLLFEHIPKVKTQEILNSNYKTIQLDKNYGVNEGTIYGNETDGARKISTYVEYLDFLGLKGDESKQKAVPKSLLN